MHYTKHVDFNKWLGHKNFKFDNILKKWRLEYIYLVPALALARSRAWDKALHRPPSYPGYFHMCKVQMSTRILPGLVHILHSSVAMWCFTLHKGSSLFLRGQIIFLHVKPRAGFIFTVAGEAPPCISSFHCCTVSACVDSFFPGRLHQLLRRQINPLRFHLPYAPSYNTAHGGQSLNACWKMLLPMK